MQSSREQQQEKRRPSYVNKQYKEIEENNRMGKIKDLFRKIGDIKGTFHARMGSIKDKNGKDLTNEIKKRSQEYTQEL